MLHFAHLLAPAVSAPDAGSLVHLELLLLRLEQL
jgi:hypothetical protein